MPSKSPASRPDIRRIGVVAGVAFAACAALIALGWLSGRPGREPDFARQTHHLPRAAHARQAVAPGGHAAQAALAPTLVTARHAPPAAASPARPAVPAKASSTAPFAAAPAQGTAAPAPPRTAVKAAVVPSAKPAPVRVATPAAAARAAMVVPAKPAPAHSAAPPVVARAAMVVPPKPAPAAPARPVVRGSMVPAAAGAQPAVAQPAARGGKPAPAAQPAQAAQADPDADFGIALPLPSQYAYNPDGRRDPFQSLLKGEFESEQGPQGQPLVDVADLSLMGVMAAGNDRYAMVEDSKHHGFTLRVGDPVMNGRVTRIEDDCLTVNLSSYGETQMVRLHLNTKRNPKVGGRP